MPGHLGSDRGVQRVPETRNIISWGINDPRPRMFGIWFQIMFFVASVLGLGSPHMQACLLHVAAYASSGGRWRSRIQEGCQASRVNSSPSW